MWTRISVDIFWSGNLRGNETNTPFSLYIATSSLLHIWNIHGTFQSLGINLLERAVLCICPSHPTDTKFRGVVRHVWGENTHTRAVNKRISLST
jgi:hypothetical protein